MKSSNPFHKIAILAGTCVTALVLSTAAIAQHGGGGGGHAGGGGGHAVGGGGFHGGGYRGGYGGYRGGYGGYRGGYGGYRGGYGYGGWHGGYGWRGGWGCCGWGWGWGGLGLGLYFATLPLYYQTYWWDGVPYYYADNNYYMYDPTVKQYETVAPPPGLQAQQQDQTGGSSELMAYPKNGQNADQQARDKFECHQWAVSQSGYDPTTGSAAAAGHRSDYMRAQAACLEGRGYSVQ